MAHKIGGEFGITHGLANAIMLPYIIRYNAKFTKKYRQLEAALGINNLSDAINALNQRLGVPKTLSQCDEVEINEVTFVNVLDRMSRHAVDDPCTLTNPNYPSVQDVKGLYTQAFYGA
jgi:alcohol dehydrogenase class IV